MGNEVVFNWFKFRTKYEAYLLDNDYYDYDELYAVVDIGLKCRGMRCKYINLVQSLKQCHGNKGYLVKVNFYTNSLDEISEIEIINDYITENYSKEMKDTNFAQNVYKYIKTTYTKSYEQFLRLRKDLKDAYSEN